MLKGEAKNAVALGGEERNRLQAFPRNAWPIFPPANLISLRPSTDAASKLLSWSPIRKLR